MVSEEEVVLFCCDWNEGFYGGECECDKNCCWGSKECSCCYDKFMWGWINMKGFWERGTMKMREEEEDEIAEW
jgi:hypothetical protein